MTAGSIRYLTTVKTLLIAIACLLAAPELQAEDKALQKSIDTIIDRFTPLSERGKEWHCTTKTEFLCSAKGCEPAKNIDTYFQLDLERKAYRMCSKGGFVLSSADSKVECLEWMDANPHASGNFFLVPALRHQGHIKIINDGSEFVAVSSFVGISHRTSFGTCRRIK